MNNRIPKWLAQYSAVILLVAVLVNLASSFTQYTHSLTLPYMQTSLGLSYTQIGALITVGWVVRNVSSFAAGTLAPRYGSRMIIGISTLAAGVAMLLLAISDNFWTAMVAMIITGLGSGAALTPMMGLLSPWFEAGNRGLAAGFASAGGSVAFVVSGLLVPWLTDKNPIHGWQHTWFIFGLLVIGIGIISICFIKTPPAVKSDSEPVPIGPARSRWPMAAYKAPLVWMVTFLVFLSGWSQGVFHTFFATFIIREYDVDLSDAGLLVICMGVLGAISGVLSGRISDRIGRGQAFFLTFLLQTVGYGLIWTFPAVWAFILCAVLIGLTLRSSYVICAASAGDYVNRTFAAAAFGLMSVGAGLGTTISPVLAGVIADASGSLRWTFILSSTATGIAMFGSLFLHHLTQNRAISAEPTSM